MRFGWVCRRGMYEYAYRPTTNFGGTSRKRGVCKIRKEIRDYLSELKHKPSLNYSPLSIFTGQWIFTGVDASSISKRSSSNEL